MTAGILLDMYESDAFARPVRPICLDPLRRALVDALMELDPAAFEALIESFRPLWPTPYDQAHLHWHIDAARQDVARTAAERGTPSG